MGDLYSILQKPDESKLSKFISSKSKQLDIENCLVLVNTYMPVKYTKDKLINYCKDNNISYFKRGEYDIFTLEEIEFIISNLNTLDTVNSVFKAYKEKYSKRHTDLTLKQFESKLQGLDLIKEGKELNKYMRYTNDVVEFVQDIGKKHTLEESLKPVQDRFPELKIDLGKLKDMKERYLIKFLETDNKFFNDNELKMIKEVSQAVSGIKELYNIFIGAFPNKCDYITFIKEISSLKMMAYYDTKEDINKFTLVERALLEELCKKEQDNAALYAMFNKVFANRYPYTQFVKKLNELKLENIPSRTTVLNQRKGREPDPTNDVLEDFLNSFKGEKTVNELVEEVNKDKRFRNYKYKSLYNFMKRRNIPYRKTGPVAKNTLTDEDWEIIKVYINKGYSASLILDKASKEIPLLKEITLSSFRQRLSKKGIRLTDCRDGEKITRKDLKEKGKTSSRSIYSKIYNDAVVTVEGNTLHQAVIELKAKHPDLADKITYASLSYFARSNNLNYVKESIEDKRDRLKKAREIKAEKNNKPEYDLDTIIEEMEEEPKDIGDIVEHVSNNIQKVMCNEEPSIDASSVNLTGVKQEDDITPYMPIIEEVNNTFERKCKQLGIEGDTHTHIQEIINALEVLTYYAKNKADLVRLTNDHEDVLEQYRREVEHEIEMQPFQSTDTYCQNKIKVIGMRRRETKYVRDDLNVMSILLKNINDNIEVYDKTIESLKHRQHIRENSVFMPLVDTNMINRLDWCKQAQLHNKRAYTPILKTNARIDRINRSKAQGRNFWTEKGPVTAPDVKQGVDTKKEHRISTYRVKAEFLALNGNPFVNKYYDIRTTNEEVAEEKAKEYFDIISANNGNAQYQIVDVTRLNR